MKTIVEAGHYCEVNGPSMLSVMGWEIGKDIVAGQEGAELVLFVDDYHQGQAFAEVGDMFFDKVKAKKTANILLEEADYVFSEAALAQVAAQKMIHLLEDGLIKLKKKVLSVAGVRLGFLRRH